MKNEFCPFCGEKMENPMAKFCPACGHALAEVESEDYVEDNEENGNDDENNIAENQPKVYKTIVDFEEAYIVATSEADKIAAINGVVIPRDPKELVQFVSLCAENISAEGKNSYDIDTAWMGKLNQAYQRAKLIRGDDPSFSRIESIYSEKNQEYKSKNGKTKKVGSWVKNHKEAAGIAGLLAFAILLILISSVGLSLGGRKFDKKIDKIHELIDEGKIDEAYREACRLEPDNKEQKQAKQNVIDRIAELQGNKNGKILLPILSDNINYVDAKTKLEQAGFTNVSAEVAAKRSGVEKYAQKVEKWAGEIKEGSVIEISVNGSVEYMDQINHDDEVIVMGTYVDPDAKIVLRYYSK